MRAATSIALALLFLGVADAEEANGLRARWADDSRALSFEYLGHECLYPGDMEAGNFPPPGAPPVFQFEKEWPVVTMRARWTASVEGWPAEHRENAIDLILLFACDAQLYEDIFPEIISSSRITHPPEIRKEAHDPDNFKLAETLRGKEIGYTVTAKAGAGAADYTIKTKIRIGLSADGKTVFYYDRPDYISDYLERKDYFFAARDAGDRIYFESRMLCVCAPRRTFRSMMMNRVEAAGKYFVERLYKYLDDAPTVEEIEGFLDKVRQQRKSIAARGCTIEPADSITGQSIPGRSVTD